MKIEIIVPYTYNEYEDTFGDVSSPKLGVS